jgi:hypothetical protein
VLSCLGPESVDLILVSTRRHLIENL